MNNLDIQRLKLTRTLSKSFEVRIVHEGGTDISAYVGNKLVQSFYWEMVDEEFSLVEIGVDQRNGQFTNLSIPLYKGTIGSCDLPPVINDTFGMPCFDVSTWRPIPGSMEGDFIQVKGRIAICLMEPDSWVVTLYNEPMVSRVSLGSKVWFGFNSVGELTHIGLNTKGATVAP